MSKVAVLPTRDAVLLPGAVNELQVGRPGSVAALRYATQNEAALLVLLQREPDVDDPGAEDLHQVGTLCRITDAERMSSEAALIGVLGIERVRVLKIERRGDALFAEVEPMEWRPAEPSVPAELLASLPLLIEHGLRSQMSAQTFLAVKAGGVKEQLGVLSVVAPMSPAEQQAVLEGQDLGAVVRALVSLRDESWMARFLRWIRR